MKVRLMPLLCGSLLLINTCLSPFTAAYAAPPERAESHQGEVETRVTEEAIRTGSDGDDECAEGADVTSDPDWEEEGDEVLHVSFTEDEDDPEQDDVVDISAVGLREGSHESFVTAEPVTDEPEDDNGEDNESEDEEEERVIEITATPSAEEFDGLDYIDPDEDSGAGEEPGFSLGIHKDDATGGEDRPEAMDSEGSGVPYAVIYDDVDDQHIIPEISDNDTGCFFNDDGTVQHHTSAESEDEDEDELVLATAGEEVKRPAPKSPPAKAKESGKGVQFFNSTAVIEGLKAVNDNDLYLLTQVICNEAGSNECSDEHQLATGQVVLNRVKSDRFPGSIQGVVSQPGQYDFNKGTNFKAMLGEAAYARARSNALRLLTGTRVIPDDCVFQACFAQGSRTYKTYRTSYSTTYICM